MYICVKLFLKESQLFIIISCWNNIMLKIRSLYNLIIDTTCVIYFAF